jgi:hypothetical protein
VPSTPLGYWRQRGIPERVIQDAVDWVFLNSEPLRLARVYGMLQRRLHNWERQRQLLLLQHIQPHLRPEGFIRESVCKVLEKESARLPGHRCPEQRGFEVDHPEGRWWRRFRLSEQEERQNRQR